MFANQVSIKDLFSTNPSHVYGGRHDTSGESGFDNSSGSQGNSQFPYSQVDFPDSQEISSQPQSQRDSAGASPGKFYQRYMSKGPMFSRDAAPSTSSNQQPKTSYQQQIQANKARAKERDERDLLNGMLTTMKDCANEVKEAVAAIKQTIDQETSKHDTNLTQSLEKIQINLNRNSEEVLKALQLREDTMGDTTQLQQQLSEREGRIIELEKQVTHLEKERNSQVFSDLEGVCHEKNRQLQDHLDRLYTDHQRELQKQALVRESQHREILVTTQQQHKTLAQQHVASIRDIEQRLDGELTEQQRKLQKERQKLRQEWEKQLTQVQKQHQHQIRELINEQMSELRDQGQQQQMDALKQQCKQVQQLQHQHRQQLENIVKEQVMLYGDQQGALLKQMIEKALQEEHHQTACLQQHHYQQLQDDMQQKYEEKISKLRSRFQQEVDIIKMAVTQPQHRQHIYGSAPGLQTSSTEGEQGMAKQASAPEHQEAVQYDKVSGEGVVVRQRRCGEDHQHITPTYSSGQQQNSPTVNIVHPELLCSSSKLLVTTAGNMDLFSSRYDRPFKSPITTIAKSWNSKTLFSKTSPSPSPVVAVRPQVHTTLDLPSLQTHQLSATYPMMPSSMVSSLQQQNSLSNTALDMSLLPATYRICQQDSSVEMQSPPTRPGKKVKKRRKSIYSHKKAKKSVPKRDAPTCVGVEETTGDSQKQIDPELVGVQRARYSLRNRPEPETNKLQQNPAENRPKKCVREESEPTGAHQVLPSNMTKLAAQHSEGVRDWTIQEQGSGMSVSLSDTVQQVGGLIDWGVQQKIDGHRQGEPRYGQLAPTVAYSSNFQSGNCQDVFNFDTEHVPLLYTRETKNSQQQRSEPPSVKAGMIPTPSWETVKAIPAPSKNSTRSKGFQSIVSPQIPLSETDEDNSQDTCEGSQNSSPSLSITDVFIKHRVKDQATSEPSFDNQASGVDCGNSYREAIQGAVLPAYIRQQRAPRFRQEAAYQSLHTPEQEVQCQVKRKHYQDQNTMATQVVQITRSVKRRMVTSISKQP